MWLNSMAVFISVEIIQSMLTWFISLYSAFYWFGMGHFVTFENNKQNDFYEFYELSGDYRFFTLIEKYKKSDFELRILNLNSTFVESQC